METDHRCKIRLNLKIRCYIVISSIFFCYLKINNSAVHWQSNLAQRTNEHFIITTTAAEDVYLYWSLRFTVQSQFIVLHIPLIKQNQLQFFCSFEWVLIFPFYGHAGHYFVVRFQCIIFLNINKKRCSRNRILEICVNHFLISNQLRVRLQANKISWYSGPIYNRDEKNRSLCE